MTTIYFVRHGLKEKVMGDPGLTEVGRKQAEYTAKFLLDKKIKYLYTGPLMRTRETADIIAETLDLSITLDPRLKERMNWGDKAGESFADFLAEWDRTQMDRTYIPYHGDSSQATGDRVQTFVEEIAQKYPDESSVAVTSGGAIGDLLLNLFPTQELSIVTNPVSGVQYIEILECSITTLCKSQDGTDVEQIGSTIHLPEQIN